MKASALLLFILSTAPSLSEAQHCAFCGTDIVLLNIHAKGSSQVIPNLRITLIDSTNTTAMYYHWKKGVYSEDTLFVWQNPSQDSFKGSVDRENFSYPENFRFPFAKSNYMILVSIYSHLRKYKVLIEDVDGKNNHGDFKPSVYYLKKSDIHPLCRNYDREEWPGIAVDIVLENK
jgi:hypothetical protein